jgi:hypothetical protein
MVIIRVRPSIPCARSQCRVINSLQIHVRRERGCICRWKRDRDSQANGTRASHPRPFRVMGRGPGGRGRWCNASRESDGTTVKSLRLRSTDERSQNERSKECGSWVLIGMLVACLRRGVPCHSPTLVAFTQVGAEAQGGGGGVREPRIPFFRLRMRGAGICLLVLCDRVV